jgi:hypothetical protein
MPKLVFRKKDIFLSAGGLLGTAGGALVKFWVHPTSFYIGGAISFVGLVSLAYGTFGIASASTRIIDEWKADLLHRSLANATPDSTIRVIQTSVPDITRLIGLLEDLLIHKEKRFRLRILLLDYENAREVLAARVQFRMETPEIHIAEVRADIDQFIRLKQRVDKEWIESRSGAKLDLQIRLYTFLPFGSVFQIGEERIFSGLFWNWTSSINGPMIVATDKKSKIWKCFEKHLTAGWEGARPIYPLPDNSSQRPS